MRAVISREWTFLPGEEEQTHREGREKTDLQSERLCASFPPLEIRSTAILKPNEQVNSGN